MCTYLTFCHSHSYIKLDTNWGEGKGNRAYVFIFCLKLLLRRTLFLTYNASLFVVYNTGADHFWLDRFEVWAFWRDSRSSNFDICQVLGWLFKILLLILGLIQHYLTGGSGRLRPKKLPFFGLQNFPALNHQRGRRRGPGAGLTLNLRYGANAVFTRKKPESAGPSDHRVCLGKNLVGMIRYYPTQNFCLY